MFKKAIMLALSGMLSLACLAQSGGNTQDKAAQANTPKKFYKLDFVVREVENGHVVNGRSYSVITRDDEHDACSVRTDTQVPYVSGKPGGGYTQFQQVQVGVDIDCRLGEEVANQAPVKISAVIRTYTPTTLGTDYNAVIARKNQWESWVVVPLRQPTVVYASDDLDSKRTTQLQLTVTPVK